MHADFELNPDGHITPTHPKGGRREGAGRKPGYSPEKVAELDSLTDEELNERPDDTNTTAIKKARAVARKEHALADQAELKYRIDSKEYLSRSAFREACATLLAELAQLRSIPDVLERRYALPPEAVEEVGRTVDEALATVAAGLELFVGTDE
jgi:phage terminase Nu1 subunit (DNA packaging protein)